MNKDIRINVSFRGHRKRKKLSAILGVNATGYLLDLWLAAAMSRPDGILIGWDETDIAIESGWESVTDGSPIRYVDALMKVGFLDRDSEGVFSLHDWTEHNPYASGADERSGKGTFNNLKRWYPEIAEALKNKGVESISKEEYKKLTTGKQPLSVTDRSPNPPYPSPYPSPDQKPFSP